MRLTDLSPEWIAPELWSPQSPPFYLGLRFLCPHCRKITVAVQFDVPVDPQNVQAKLRETGTWPDAVPQASGTAVRWRRIGETFDALTLEPSINQPNHWHGHIKNGEVTQ